METDYHTHTPLCHHAEGTPQEYVEAAIAAGLSEYGISDHAPQTPEPFDDWRMAMADLPRYLDWIAEARAHAGNELTIFSGLECDWLPNGESHIETLLTAHDWDFLIGSVHYLPGKDGSKWDFDNPAHLSQWQALSPSDLEDLWTLYWKQYENMIRSRLFTFGGHPDLIKKFAFTPTGDLSRFYEPVIQALVDTGGAFEINTAGLHKPCEEQYPGRATIWAHLPSPPRRNPFSTRKAVKTPPPTPALEKNASPKSPRLLQLQAPSPRTSPQSERKS